MQVEKLKTIDADTLLSTPMNKTLFVVDGLIPQGLSVLSGSSKIGKSWLMLWLGIQVASGQPVWEFETHKSNVLYLCLEDTYSTLTAQRRALYRGKSKTTPADYSEQIQALTARIRELRREITTCADIEMDCEMVQDKVQRAAHRRENPPRERIHRRAY